MDQTDVGVIKKPTFLSPPNNGAVSKYSFELQTSAFEDTHINKDSHKQSTWQVSIEPTFSSIKWAFTSFIFKTVIEVPPEELNFNTAYYVRVKYYGHKYQSEWSDQISFDPEISEWGNPPARVSIPEYIGYGSEPGELKHLSTQRKRNQTRFPK